MCRDGRHAGWHLNGYLRKAPCLVHACPFAVFGDPGQLTGPPGPGALPWEARLLGCAPCGPGSGAPGASEPLGAMGLAREPAFLTRPLRALLRCDRARILLARRSRLSAALRMRPRTRGPTHRKGSPGPWNSRVQKTHSARPASSPGHSEEQGTLRAKLLVTLQATPAGGAEDQPCAHRRPPQRPPGSRVALTAHRLPGAQSATGRESSLTTAPLSPGLRYHVSEARDTASEVTSALHSTRLLHVGMTELGRRP